MKLSELDHDRLAVFVHDSMTGKPLRRVPVYAELDIGPGEASSPVITASLEQLAAQNPSLARSIEQAIFDRVSATWLAADGRDERFIRDVLNRLDEAGVTFDEDPASVAEKIDAAVAITALRSKAPSPSRRNAHVPLGVLSTDHVGLVSFDLTRVRSHLKALATTGDHTVTFVATPGLRDAAAHRFVGDRAVGDEAVVERIGLDSAEAATASNTALNLPALQTPGLIEWRLSPGSFASVPQALIGADGCETLTPATFATSRYTLRQVVRLAQEEEATGPPKAHVYEYALTLTPLGHSLGEVLYTLPLAPGETVRLAVVDWRRDVAAAKDSSTILSEKLLHDQAHDRVVSETVHAALDEWQRGGSVMGGVAGGAGGSGNIGLMSAAGGAMLSIGGGYATSSGSRDFAADTVQKVTDAVHQSSVAVREQHSSVVVQVSETEKETVETRAFANHNRGHTLTVLYHEVLRHFRVETSFIRRHDALLLTRRPWKLHDHVLLAKRHVLEPVLLDRGLAPAFDALARLETVRSDINRKAGSAPVAPPWDGDLEILDYRLAFNVAKETTTNAISMKVWENGTAHFLTVGDDFNLNRNEDFDREGPKAFLAQIPKRVRWRDIDAFHITKESGDDDVEINEINIEGRTSAGNRILHAHRMGATYKLVNDDQFFVLDVVQPPAPPPTPPGPPTAEQVISAEDLGLINRLKAHIDAEIHYYRRVLDLTQDPNAVTELLETMKVFGATDAIDLVAPIPLEVLGTKVAFPMLATTDESPPEIDSEERLVSLPTRGVFAEAKLGHCNVAEEIDETRFWRWDEHPLPFIASDIAPVQVVQPTSQSPDLSAPALPSPSLAIQQPVSLPAPTNMGAVLEALTRSDAFRDMSAKKEVQELLGDLIEGSVSMAGAATKAREIQTKLESEERNQQGAAAARLAEAAIKADSAKAESDAAKAQQVTPAEVQHASKVAENLASKGLISQEKAKEAVTAQVSNLKGGGPAVAPKRTISILFKFANGDPMPGDFTAELEHSATSTFYPSEDSTTTSDRRYLKIPASLKGAFLLTIRGTIMVPDGTLGLIQPASWKHTINTTEGGTKLESLGMVDVVASTKELDLKFEFEREKGKEWSTSTSNGWEAKVGASGDVKVVKLSGEYAYASTDVAQNTTTTGDKETWSVSMKVLAIDPQVQPRITLR